MSDRLKNLLLSLAAGASLSAIALVASMWADVREWNRYRDDMKAERMAALEMQVKSDKELFNSRIDALNARFGELSTRMDRDR